MTRPTGYRSPLAPYAASMRDPDPAKGREAAVEIWERSNGEIAVFSLKGLSWPMATRVKQLFEEIYGKRKETDQ